MVVFIRENSRLARLAALKLGKPNAAIVFGNTIHLWGATRRQFMRDERWLKHEVAHVYQYQRYGILFFLYFYLADSIKNGYLNNRFEKEARSYEQSAKILDNVVFR